VLNAGLGVCGSLSIDRGLELVADRDRAGSVS
jgi:hypothetical protein